MSYNVESESCFLKYGCVVNNEKKEKENKDKFLFNFSSRMVSDFYIGCYFSGNLSLDFGLNCLKVDFTPNDDENIRLGKNHNFSSQKMSINRVLRYPVIYDLKEKKL